MCFCVYLCVMVLCWRACMFTVWQQTSPHTLTGINTCHVCDTSDTWTKPSTTQIKLWLHVLFNFISSIHRPFFGMWPVYFSVEVVTDTCFDCEYSWTPQAKSDILESTSWFLLEIFFMIFERGTMTMTQASTPGGAWIHRSSFSLAASSSPLYVRANTYMHIHTWDTTQ